MTARKRPTYECGKPQRYDANNHRIDFLFKNTIDGSRLWQFGKYIYEIVFRA